jgi:hypothetical protein
MFTRAAARKLFTNIEEVFFLLSSIFFEVCDAVYQICFLGTLYGWLLQLAFSLLGQVMFSLFNSYLKR